VPQKGSEKVGLALERPGLAPCGRREFLEVEESQIRQRVQLQIAPHVLDGIQLRRVGREELGRELAVRSEEVLHEIRAMGIQPIPDQNHGRVDLDQELPEEVDDPLGVDVGIRMEAKVEADVVALGRHAQRPDGGHLAMGPPTVVEQWCFAPWVPRAPHERRHHQATLVEEREPGLPPRGFFLMRGQSFRIQPRMRSSLRSRARR